MALHIHGPRHVHHHTLHQTPYATSTTPSLYSHAPSLPPRCRRRSRLSQPNSHSHTPNYHSTSPFSTLCQTWPTHTCNTPPTHLPNLHSLPLPPQPYDPRHPFNTDDVPTLPPLQSPHSGSRPTSTSRPHTKTLPVIQTTITHFAITYPSHHDPSNWPYRPSFPHLPASPYIASHASFQPTAFLRQIGVFFSNENCDSPSPPACLAPARVANPWTHLEITSSLAANTAKQPSPTPSATPFTQSFTLWVLSPTFAATVRMCNANPRPSFHITPLNARLISASHLFPPQPPLTRTSQRAILQLILPSPLSHRRLPPSFPSSSHHHTPYMLPTKEVLAGNSLGAHPRSMPPSSWLTSMLITSLSYPSPSITLGALAILRTLSFLVHILPPSFQPSPSPLGRTPTISLTHRLSSLISAHYMPPLPSSPVHPVLGKIKRAIHTVSVPLDPLRLRLIGPFRPSPSTFLWL